MGGHLVEAFGQRLHLVAGLHIDAVSQFAGADLGRALLEGADRLDHAAGQEDAGADREEHAEDDQQPGPLHGCGHSLEGLLQRLLDEDTPPKRGDRGMGGEDAAALEVAGDGHLISRRCAGALPASAARTWGSWLILVFWSTRLMSGWAISAPWLSTTKARPAFPDLDLQQRPQMNLRLTSAAVHTPTATAGKRDDGKRHDHVRLGSLRK